MVLYLLCLYIDFHDDMKLILGGPCKYSCNLHWQGDEIEEFQPLCAVQSDKATIEITSRYKGKVAQLLHVPGNIVKVSFIFYSFICFFYFWECSCGS